MPKQRSRRIQGYTVGVRRRLDRVVELLQTDGAMSTHDMAELLHMSKASLESLVFHLCHEHRFTPGVPKRIRVAFWERRHIGRPLPFYAAGKSRDAVRPQPFPPSEVSARYRARHRKHRVNPDPLLKAWVQPEAP